MTDLRNLTDHELLALVEQGMPIKDYEAEQERRRREEHLKAVSLGRDPVTGVETYSDGSMFHHPV